MRFAIANKDRAVLDLEDTRIGDSHSEDVGGKVLEACFTGADGLGIDIPVDLPDLRGDLIEETGFSHCIAELGLEDLRESSDGEIEIDPWRDARGHRWWRGRRRGRCNGYGGETRGCDPRCEGRRRTREICADELFIGGQFLDRFGGSLEQGGVGRRFGSYG